MLEIDTKFNSDEKLWEGPKIKPLFNPKVSMGRVILSMLSMHGPKIAQISDDFGVQNTFNEILTKTVRVAQNLKKFNCLAKSVFGIVTNNGPDVAPIVFASLCLGCPISPIDPAFPKLELKSILNLSKPNTIFCDVTTYDAIELCLKELNIAAQIFTFHGQRKGSVAVETLFIETNNENNFIPIDIDGENETAIIASSYGITGSFEGICLSHALLLDKCTRLNSISSGDILFTTSSLYWLSGIGNLLKATYFGATRIITSNPLSPDQFLALIQKYKVTHIFASVQQIMSALSHESIKKTDLSSVKSIGISGPQIALDQYSCIRKNFTNAVPYKMYGVSELGGAISISRGDELKQSLSGKLVNGTQVKIVDANGNRLGVDKRGRIFVKSAYHFLGYYGNDGIKSIIDAEQFVRTGAIGYFDLSGFLHVIGREIDIIKCKNHDISPKEIEDTLTQISAIQSVCIVGVSTQDNDNLLAALIVRAQESSISQEGVNTLVTTTFDENYKLHGGIYFVPSLPLTPSGKVIRRLAQGIAQNEFNCNNKISKAA